MKRFLGTYVAALLVLALLVTSPIWWPVIGSGPAGDRSAVFGASTRMTALALAVSAVLVVLPAVVVRQLVSISPPRFPLTYSPPTGLGPVQAAALLPGASPAAAFRAAVMHARNHDLIRLERDGYVLVLRAGERDGADLDEATRKVSLLIDTGAATRLDESTRMRVSVVRGRVLGAARQWVEDQGLLVPAPIRPHHVKTRAALVSLCPAVIMVLQAIPDVPTMWILIPGILTAAGLATLAMEAGRKMVATVGILVVALVPHFAIVVTAGREFVGTWGIVALILLFCNGVVHQKIGFEGRGFLVPSETGRQVWSELGGFRRALATESSRDRFDFAGRQDLFLAYLPWAVLFGIEEIWASNLEVEYRAEDNPLFFFEPGIEAWGLSQEVGIAL